MKKYIKSFTTYTDCWDIEVRITREDNPNIPADEAISDYFSDNFRFGEDYGFMQDRYEDWDWDTESYVGYVDVTVSEVGMKHLRDAGIKFTVI